MLAISKVIFKSQPSLSSIKKRLLFVQPRMSFSQSDLERQRARDAFDQKEREKINKAPEVDEKEFVSFQDTYMMPRVIAFTALICGAAYYVHTLMHKRLEKHKRRIEGNDTQDQPTKFREIGDHWVLKDTSGKPFGSKSLSGSYYLLYFGSSLCPDVCPISLMKMNKALRKIKRSNEAKQYFNVKGVFVTVNPERDTPTELKKYCEMFDANLIGLREDTNMAPNLQNMLTAFKVPVGMNENEREVVKEYFNQKQPKKRFWNRKQKFDPLEGMINDHSRVFYLMAPDNKFLAFYSLEIDENELADQMMEEISYDLGIKYIGSGKKPPVNFKE